MVQGETAAVLQISIYMVNSLQWEVQPQCIRKCHAPIAEAACQTLAPASVAGSWNFLARFPHGSLSTLEMRLALSSLCISCFSILSYFFSCDSCSVKNLSPNPLKPWCSRQELLQHGAPQGAVPREDGHQHLRSKSDKAGGLLSEAVLDTSALPDTIWPLQGCTSPFFIRISSHPKGTLIPEFLSKTQPVTMSKLKVTRPRSPSFPTGILKHDVTCLFSSTTKSEIRLCEEEYRERHVNELM